MRDSSISIADGNSCQAVSDKYSDLTQSEDILRAAKNLVVALDRIFLKKRVDVCTISKILAAVHTFLKHVLHLALTYYKDVELF